MKKQIVGKWALLAVACLAIVGCRSMDTRRATGGVGPGTDFVDSAVPHRAMVWHIESVNASLDSTQPGQVVAHVRAEAPTSGWINPEFVPFVYATPPKDGIYEFALTAERPGGVAMQRITPFDADLVWRNPPPGVRGVRIHAVENHKEDHL
jgi:hypothetical protein